MLAELSVKRPLSFGSASRGTADRVLHCRNRTLLADNEAKKRPLRTACLGLGSAVQATRRMGLPCSRSYHCMRATKGHGVSYET